MIHAIELGGALVIVGQGEATKPDPRLFEPSLRNTVRYADPAAWVTAAAVARAVAASQDRWSALRDQIGVIVTSDDGPQETMRTVADAAIEGLSSPMRYPASNPGSLTGVTCIAFGFRGPTLNLIVSPEEGVGLGLLIASGWLSRRAVPYVVLAACSSRKVGTPEARSLFLSAGNPSPVQDFNAAGDQGLGENAARWMIAVGEAECLGGEAQ